MSMQLHGFCLKKSLVWKSLVLRQNVTKSTNCTHGWRLKRQSNGNAIMVDGQKPMLHNSIDKDESQRVPNVNTTGNNQQSKKRAVGSWAGSILTFNDLRLTNTLLG